MLEVTGSVVVANRGWGVPRALFLMLMCGQVEKAEHWLRVDEHTRLVRLPSADTVVWI